MKIMVIPTTDWISHPVPNRLNFIFDDLAGEHEVHVCHLKLKKFKDNPTRETKCSLHDMGGRLTDDPSLYYMINAFSHAHRLKKIINGCDIDIIVSANIIPSYIANMVSSVPIVYDYLDHFEESAAIYYPDSIIGSVVKKVTRRIVAENLRKASAIITVTDYFADLLQKNGSTNINVIPNGVDTNLMRPIPTENAKESIGIEGTILGYAGSLEHWIDLETVFHGIPEIAVTIPDVKVLVIGPSLFTDYGMKLHHLSKKLNIQDRVIFTGIVSYPELYKYISAFDIALNPRKPLKMNKLTMGGKVFNYLACGKPVLSSNMDLLEKMFSSKEGVFCYNSKMEFVQQVQNILNMYHDSTHYRDIAMKYDWTVLADDYEKVLMSCL
jgi:glycosyltransferase involved in cell wall biosynthesis